MIEDTQLIKLRVLNAILQSVGDEIEKMYELNQYLLLKVNVQGIGKIM